MRTPAYQCECCGSANLRLSRRHSKAELLKTWLGYYPFRCLDCNHRFWINVWLFSKLAYAKCPKCLGCELTTWPTRHYHLSLWKKLLMTFGAHRYKCAGCRYRFLSFRPCESGTINAQDEPVEASIEENLEPETLPGQSE